MRIAQATDLSHLLKTGMPIYPGDPAVEITPAATIVPDGFNVLNVHLRFAVWDSYRRTIPLRFPTAPQLMSSGPVFFLCAATVAVATGLAQNSEIPPGDDSCTFRPGRSSVDQHRDGRNTGEQPNIFSHPYLGPHAARLIVQRGYSVVAIDALSVDQTEGVVLESSTPTWKYSAQTSPLRRNLTNLASITWSNPWVSMLPIKIEAGDGAPIRAIGH